MSDQTKIQWTDHTFNPWEGCTKVSPGCTNCYAETRNYRFGNDNWGKGKPRRRTSIANWKKPLKWNNDAQRFYECALCGTREHRAWHASLPPGGLQCCSNPDCDALPESETSRATPRIFCASLADWLDEEVPIEWLADLLSIIRQTPNLDWQLLTKRPENWRLRLAKVAALYRKHGAMKDWEWLVEWTLKGNPPTNVWIGTSVENQQYADQRVPLLEDIPATVRFLSAEPLLGPIDFTALFGQPDPSIHWVIVGGESGRKSRPFDLHWASEIRDHCAAANVAFFMKQLGDNPQESDPDDPDSNSDTGYSITTPKGGDPTEWPQHLRIRQFPLIVQEQSPNTPPLPQDFEHSDNAVQTS